jgi:hypothetical protein
MEIYDKYKNLKEAEKQFLWAHPLAAADFNQNAATALQEAQKRFSSATLHNGSGDAFRHCFWSAMNARDQGKNLAKMFGEAHEDFDGNPSDEKAMDLHNNGAGFEIGANSPGASDRHLAVLCVQAWSTGKLVQMNAGKSSDLVYSNSTETFVYGGSQ